MIVNIAGWKTEEVSRCRTILVEREGLWTWKWAYIEVSRSGFCCCREGRSSILCFSRNFKPKGRNLSKNVSFLYFLLLCIQFFSLLSHLQFFFLSFVVLKLLPWRFRFLLWRKTWRKNISDGALHRLIMKDRLLACRCTPIFFHNLHLVVWESLNQKLVFNTKSKLQDSEWFTLWNMGLSYPALGSLGNKFFKILVFSIPKRAVGCWMVHLVCPIQLWVL